MEKEYELNNTQIITLYIFYNSYHIFLQIVQSSVMDVKSRTDSRPCVDASVERVCALKDAPSAAHRCNTYLYFTLLNISSLGRAHLHSSLALV